MILNCKGVKSGRCSAIVLQTFLIRLRKNFTRVQRKRSRKKVAFDPERIQCAEPIEKFWELDLLPESFKIVLFETKLDRDPRFSFQITLRTKLRCLRKSPWRQVEVTNGEKYSCLACFILTGQNGDVVA